MTIMLTVPILRVDTTVLVKKGTLEMDSLVKILMNARFVLSEIKINF